MKILVHCDPHSRQNIRQRPCDVHSTGIYFDLSHTVLRKRLARLNTATHRHCTKLYCVGQKQMPEFVKHHKVGFAVAFAVFINLMDACTFGTILFPAELSAFNVSKWGICQLEIKC